MPATSLFHPDDGSSKKTGRLGTLTKREAASLASLKVLARKQGLSLGLVRGPGEQNDVCLLRFLRAQGFEEKRALASLVSCVEWGAGVGLSGLRGHLGGGGTAGGAPASAGAPTPLPAAEGVVCLGSGVDRLGRPLAIVRLAGLSHELVETCGKKALLRYFVWSVERVLERVAASMLSTQFIIEGTTVLVDAKGWNLDNASDSVLGLLQDAASIGLLRYPERLGQLLVVNVPAARAGGLLIAAGALGLGAAIDGGRLRVLPGDLPKWAPELRKAVSPEQLPVEYGGTAPALPRVPAAPRPNGGGSAGGATAGNSSEGGRSSSGAGSHARGAGAGRNKLGSGGLLHAFLFLWNGGGSDGSDRGGGPGGGGAKPFGKRTSYEIAGSHAIALALTLWALHRESPLLGEYALLVLAVVLLAREWVGGAATLPSAALRVPLLHDPRALVAAKSRGSRNLEGLATAAAATTTKPEDGSRGLAGGVVVGGSGDGGGGGAAAAVGDGLEGVSLVGAVADVVEVAGRGKSGFDRFCIRVTTEASPKSGGITGQRKFVTWRRLTEFVALRAALLEAGWPAAEGGDRDLRMWTLPPVVPFGLLMQRLGTWLRNLLRDPKLAGREELRRFLLDARITMAADRAGVGAAPPPGASGRAPQGPPAAAAAAAASSRRRTAPTLSSTAHEPLPPISVASVAGPVGGVGAGYPAAKESSEELAERDGGSGGGTRVGHAREIPSLRPEVKSMFQDPGECHSLKIPQREQNQWLRRANRTSASAAAAGFTTSSPSANFASPAAGGTSEGGASLSRPASAESMGMGGAGGGTGAGPRPPPWAEEGGAAAAADPAAWQDGMAWPGCPGTPPNTAATGAWSSVSSPGRDNGGRRGGGGGASSPRRKDGTASPRRREALRRFVSLVKRKGGGKRGAGLPYAAGFRLLHVDVFQVPPDNHLHRVDHIVGRTGGRAQARVKELTASQPAGSTFLFVVNLQLPRSFTKETWAASVVLYWGVPAECLGGAGTSPLGSSLSTPPPQPQRQPQPPPRSAGRSSSLAPTPHPASSASEAPPPLHLATFERELLMRYVDLPFNRMHPGGSGFVSSEAAGSAASAAAAAAAATAGRGGGEHGVPGFSAVDEDESESGVFSDKDFRNMSLKVVTSVVEGRWTVRKAVDEGNSQVLSRKLTQRYFRGSHYMETDIEIGSSVAAESVVGVCLTEPAILDVGFFLEGGHRVLGCVRVNNLKLSAAEPLLLLDSAPPPPPPPLRKVSTPPGMALSPKTRRMADAVGGGGATSGGEEIPLGNPQFHSTWEDSGESHRFRVRGPGYLSGGGKVDAGSPFGKLVRADLFKMEAGVDRMDNIGSVGRAAKVVRRLRKRGQFLVIVNLQVPGNPPLSMVLYYAVPVPPGGVPEEGAGGRSPAFLDLFRRFVDLGGSEDEEDEEGEGQGGVGEEAGGGGRLPGDDLRNLRFKLFPAILEGPWIVRKAVGSKPTLIAQKLTCRYFRTRSYFEVDIDIGSSVVAYNTVSLAIGYAKALVVDMGFCVQGEADEELPEVMLGVVRVRKLDVLLADNLGANEDPEDASDSEEDDDDDDSDDAGQYPGGQEEVAGAAEQRPVAAEAPPAVGGKASGSGGAAAGTEALGPKNAATATDPSVFAVPAGGGAHGSDPITSPGLEGVFTDSGDMHGLRVRGSTYLKDRRKIFAGPSFGTLVRADLFRVDGNRHHLFRVDHICAHGRMKDRVEFLRSGLNPPFLFIVNIQMPGDRAHSVVLCWGMRLKEAMEAEAAGRLSKEDGNFLRLLSRYISLDLEGGLPVHDIRNRRLKLFPKVLEGPWVVRKAVGKPCVIGKKLTARYFRRPGYFEVDIDVGSSTLASNATHLAGGYAKNLVLDLAFALQGESEDELPERLIGSARIVRPDLGRAEPLDW